MGNELRDTPEATPLHKRYFGLLKCFQFTTRTESKVMFCMGVVSSARITPKSCLGLSMVMFRSRMLR